MNKPIYDEEEKDILGYLVKEFNSWQAQTVFGYTIGRAETETEAVAIIRKQGKDYLKGVWQYYDKDDHDWFPCIIENASEVLVTVVRTNAMGYQEPEHYKHVVLKQPDENILIKNS